MFSSSQFVCGLSLIISHRHGILSLQLSLSLYPLSANKYNSIARRFNHLLIRKGSGEWHGMILKSWNRNPNRIAKIPPLNKILNWLWFMVLGRFICSFHSSSSYFPLAVWRLTETGHRIQSIHFITQFRWELQRRNRINHSIPRRDDPQSHSNSGWSLSGSVMFLPAAGIESLCAD